MKIYKVVIGWINIQLPEGGQLVFRGERIPVAPFNIVVDSPETIDYLIQHKHIIDYELVEQKEAPVYLDYELN